MRISLWEGNTFMYDSSQLCLYSINGHVNQPGALQNCECILWCAANVALFQFCIISKDEGASRFLWYIQNEIIIQDGGREGKGGTYCTHSNLTLFPKLEDWIFFIKLSLLFTHSRGPLAVGAERRRPGRARKEKRILSWLLDARLAQC